MKPQKPNPSKKRRKRNRPASSPAWSPLTRLQHVWDAENPEATIWGNNRYQVIKETVPSSNPSLPLLIHLSIRRLDRAAIHDWRDFQRIKNELVGPQCEGIEIYPAEERLVDAVNQYHLWVFADPSFRLSIGFQQRLVAEGPYPHQAIQRPWEPDMRPADCVSEEALRMLLREKRIPGA